MKVRKLIIDIQTGKTTDKEIDFVATPFFPVKGLNTKKLKTLLKAKGIIKDYTEVE